MYCVHNIMYCVHNIMYCVHNIMYCVHNIMYCVNNIMGQNGTIISDFILNFQGPTVLVFTLKDSKYYSPVV